jgi:hypothetical protein
MGERPDSSAARRQPKRYPGVFVCSGIKITLEIRQGQKMEKEAM